jgi:hypothetical protein
VYFSISYPPAFSRRLPDIFFFDLDPASLSSGNLSVLFPVNTLVVGPEGLYRVGHEESLPPPPQSVTPPLEDDGVGTLKVRAQRCHIHIEVREEAMPQSYIVTYVMRVQCCHKSYYSLTFICQHFVSGSTNTHAHKHRYTCQTQLDSTHTHTIDTPGPSPTGAFRKWRYRKYTPCAP